MLQRIIFPTLLSLVVLTGCGQSRNEPQLEPDLDTPSVTDQDLDDVDVIVEERVAQLVADAGEDRSLYEGDTLELDASSTAYDGDESLVFLWHQTKGPTVHLDEYQTDTLSLVAPLVDEATEIEFSVTVGDGKVVDQAHVVIEVLNRPDPTAIALSPMGHTFAVGEEIMLDASLSLSDSGNDLEFEWVQTGGPAVEIEEPANPTIQFVAPEIAVSATEMLFDVIVHDGPVSATAMLRLVVYAPNGATFGGGGGGSGVTGGGAAAAPAPGVPTAPVNTNPGSIAGFTLINADTNDPFPGFDPFESGAVVDLDDMAALAIQAHPGATAPASIRMVLRQDGQIIANQVENQAPYSLFGDDGSGFLPWDAVGPFSGSTYILTATPFAEPGARGVLGSSVSITFDTTGSVQAPGDNNSLPDEPDSGAEEPTNDPPSDDPPADEPEPECNSDGDCDDGVFCNGAESCADGTCVTGNAPCSDTTCDESSNACDVPVDISECASNADCDNGLFCSGVRECVDGSCVNGASPCGSGEVCDEQVDDCVVPEGQVLYVGHDIADDTAPYCTIDNPCTTPQEAVDRAGPGDTIIVRGGTYTSNTTTRAAYVINIESGGVEGLPLTIKAAPGEHVTLSGNNGTSDNLVRIVAPYVTLEGFEMTQARRIGVYISGPAHDVTIRMCHAHHNNHDIGWIGAAFRTVGPVYNILFEDCISDHNSGGFQLREGGTLTADTALTPPIAGNIGFPNGLAENQWDSWPGWSEYGASYVTLRRCMAYDNLLLPEHSDGIGIRYGDRCTIEDCILFRNADDGMDVLGSTRCLVKGNIVFKNNHLNVPNGDGNGIKIGVRGGLDHIVYNNTSFDNKRGGIDMADTERAIVFNNTTVGNGLWFGLWFEGGRSTTGHTVFNNVSCFNPKADIGRSGHVIMASFLSNLMSDNNDHNWAPDIDETSLINTDPLFLDLDLAIDTNFPATMSIPQKMQFIRSQVIEKFSLSGDSPANDIGTVLPGLSTEYLGAGPDLGAIEGH